MQPCSSCTYEYICIYSYSFNLLLHILQVAYPSSAMTYITFSIPIIHNGAICELGHFRQLSGTSGHASNTRSLTGFWTGSETSTGFVSAGENRLPHLSPVSRPYINSTFSIFPQSTCSLSPRSLCAHTCYFFATEKS